MSFLGRLRDQGRAVPHCITFLAIFAATPLQADDRKTRDAPKSNVIEYGDWSTACDNSGECTAVSVSRAYVKRIEGSDPGDYTTPKMWVKRRAGPDALPHVFVDTSIWGEARSEAALTLHVYYNCDGECTGRAYSLKQIEPGRYELAPEQVADFFAESTGTTRAATRRSDGSVHGIITTDGLVAAARFIDEHQGRKATVTAIYAKGKKPASTVPPEQTRPSVKTYRGIEASIIEMQDTKALQQKQREYCDTDTGGIEPDIQSFSFTNGQKLWSIGCSSNPYFERRLWLIQTGGGSFEAHSFPRPERGPEQRHFAELPVLPNSGFDPLSGLMSSYSGGMCGWRRRWAWTGAGFEMIDAIEMPACADILPRQWLQTYRAAPYFPD